MQYSISILGFREGLIKQLKQNIELGLLAIEKQYLEGIGFKLEIKAEEFIWAADLEEEV